MTLPDFFFFFWPVLSDFYFPSLRSLLWHGCPGHLPPTPQTRLTGQPGAAPLSQGALLSCPAAQTSLSVPSSCHCHAILKWDYLPISPPPRHPCHLGLTRVSGVFIWLLFLVLFPLLFLFALHSCLLLFLLQESAQMPLPSFFPSHFTTKPRKEALRMKPRAPSSFSLQKPLCGLLPVEIQPLGRRPQPSLGEQAGAESLKGHLHLPGSLTSWQGLGLPKSHLLGSGNSASCLQGFSQVKISFI